MIEFEFRKTLVLIVVMTLFSMSTSQLGKIDARADVWMEIAEYENAGESKIVKNVYLNWLKSFVWGENSTRFGIVTSLHHADLTDQFILELTTDQKKFDDTLKGWDGTRYRLGVTPKFLYAHSWGYIRSLKARGSRSDDRAQIVVMIIDRLIWSPSLLELPKRLRQETGTFIYCIAKLRNDEPMALGCSGSEDRTFVYDQKTFTKTLQDTLKEVHRAVHRDLCGWKSICRFPDKTRMKCVPEV